MNRIPAALLAVIAGASSLSACGLVETDPTDYSPEIRSNFVESCSEPGALTEAQCGCMYKDIKSNLKFDEFLSIDKKLRDDPDTMPPEAEEVLQAAAQECL